MSDFLSSRREFLYLYDIKMGNPNGDPDENRPRVLPDGTFYVTDVRLKRFIRDYLKNQHDILVDTVEGKTTNLTGRVAEYLNSKHIKQCQGKELVDILLASFIDARMFGSSFAFKAQETEVDGKKAKWEPKPEPKTLTGAIQIQHGEVLHRAQEVDIHGTSIFGSLEEKSQGTFTTYFALRYALIGFSGVANEHAAHSSRMSDQDYAIFLNAMWNSVRSAGNTRTKRGQSPRLLISVQYKAGVEFQYGRLSDYLKLRAVNKKAEKEWSSPEDYTIDLATLVQRLEMQKGNISEIRFCLSPDLQVTQIPEHWKDLGYDSPQ